MTFKQKIFLCCCELLDEKISSLKNSLSELERGSENDTKSSAGDKHETARAMMQIEQEKLGRQLNELQEQKNVLEKIDVENYASKITKGSLVTTNKGYLFISIPIGKIRVEEKEVIVISPQSPLGLKLMGLKMNDTAEMNSIKYIIEKLE